MTDANTIIVGDCLSVLATLDAESVDFVMGSPPYENARTYGIEFSLSGQDWVDWMVSVTQECLRVCRGLVCFVVEGRTKRFRWSATPALLMADLHRAGIHLRKPPIFQRVGIPGSGGPDWWRNDYEFCVCCTKGGRLPWSDNTANGHEPKYRPGGDMSNRKINGARVRKHTTPDGRDVLRQERQVISRNREGMHSQTQRGYTLPQKANAGNVIRCKVGGGQMGHQLAHENEAPYPESLVEPFIQCFCPHGGIVLDPFCGSGTTLAVAHNLGRKWIGIDLRESQVALARRRIHGPLFAEAK